MPEHKCHIRTSGWNYAHWAKGRFYPKGLKQGDWPAFFADQFGTVVVPMSFYRLPRPEMIGVPLGLPLLLVGAVKAVLWHRDPHRILPGCCQQCGHDLTGNVSGICPECGKRMGHGLI